jgi:hypothetical protein
MCFFFKRPPQPKVYIRDAVFHIKDVNGNTHAKLISLREKLFWAFDDWHIFWGEEEFEKMIEQEFFDLGNKGLIAGNNFIFPRDMISITLVEQTKTEIV